MKNLGIKLFAITLSVYIFNCYNPLTDWYDIKSLQSVQFSFLDKFNQNLCYMYCYRTTIPQGNTTLWGLNFTDTTNNQSMNVSLFY